MYKRADKRANSVCCSPQVVSADGAGVVKTWNSTSPEQCRSVQTGTTLTSAVIHENADIFAIASRQQFIGVLSQEGAALSTIKYHEGFMGQRIGLISCMAFHPYKVLIAGALNLYKVPLAFHTRILCIKYLHVHVLVHVYTRRILFV